MSFACGCAHMISYYCTMKFLPFPAWRKLFPISSKPPSACGSSKAGVTPWSPSLIPHATFMLASPWIRAGVSQLPKETQEQGREPKCHQVDGHSWTKPHSAANLGSCSHMTYGNTIDRNHYRQNLYFLSSHVDSSLENCWDNILMSNFLS